MHTHHRSEEKEVAGEDELRRNPYEVLGIPSNSTDQEIKSAYRRMALRFQLLDFLENLSVWLLMYWVRIYFRYHPDKNPNDPVAADMFKEVTFAYDVLSDPENRRQYDTTASEVQIPYKSYFFNFDWLIWKSLHHILQVPFYHIVTGCLVHNQLKLPYQVLHY